MNAASMFRCALAVALLASSPVLADWKTFLHGEPAPFVKSPPPKQLALVSTAPNAAADAQVEDFMRAFAAALMARDASGVLPRLSERYAVEGAPDEMKPAELMAQAIGKMRGPTEIVVQSVATVGAERIAKVELRYGTETSKLRTFRFDAKGRLLSSDLFTLARG
jgi:hypothetical protein